MGSGDSEEHNDVEAEKGTTDAMNLGIVIKNI